MQAAQIEIKMCRLQVCYLDVLEYFLFWDCIGYKLS